MSMISPLQTLGLLEVKGVGRKTVRRAQQLGSPADDSDDLLSLLQKVKDRYPRSRVPAKEDVAEGIQKAKDIVDACRSSEVDLIVPGQEDFPCSLTGLEDCPPILYRRGAGQLRSPAVAIVGTRSPSRYGERCAERLGHIFAGEGFRVVSGLALGCDAAAHRGCLKSKGRTEAVLAHGLDEVYPKKNASLARDILESGGTLWSEYPPDTPPRSHQYVQRNRLQSGLSEGVIVVEAGPDSGTLHTARFALEQGRALACLAPQEEEGKELQSGNEKLIEEGAFSLHEDIDIQRFIDFVQGSNFTGHCRTN